MHGAREAEPHQAGSRQLDLEGQTSHGWRCCGDVTQGVAGPILGAVWVLVAVRAAATRAPGPGQEGCALQGSRRDGVLGSPSVRKNEGSRGAGLQGALWPGQREMQSQGRAKCNVGPDRLCRVT